MNAIYFILQAVETSEIGSNKKYILYASATFVAI